jgi:hypothetical protein
MSHVPVAKIQPPLVEPNVHGLGFFELSGPAGIFTFSVVSDFAARLQTQTRPVFCDYFRYARLPSAERGPCKLSLAPRQLYDFFFREAA